VLRREEPAAESVGAALGFEVERVDGRASEPRGGRDRARVAALAEGGVKELLDALEALVDRCVEAKLASLGLARAEYSSASLPPGVTARTYARWCRSGRVAGAERDGAGWRCSAEAWRKARGQGSRRPSRPTLTVVPNDDAAALLAAAGLRPTRNR
jgi:hypothetical protein